MPTTILSAGNAYAITQSIAYALPPVLVHIHSTAALDVSVNGTDYVAVTATTTGTTIAAMFVKCTAATNCVVAVKRV